MTTQTLLLSEGRNCWRMVRARRAAFLIDGAAYFEAFATAVSRARESILIVGWDIDSRVRLVHDHRPLGLPPDLGGLLNALVSRRHGLHVHILAWDFAMIFALERQPLPVVQLGWRTHRRVHFRLDGKHPVGASHHQKIVVIDDAMAFVGGLDLARRRWDTPDHLPDNPRRVTPDGQPYAPFHDVQMAVDGQAAAALGDLVRERWRGATGQQLRAPRHGASDPWPPGLPPALHDVTIAIARTEPAYNEHPEVREVETLYLDAIAAARHWVYIENQYLTAATFAEALANRLLDPVGPEIVLVLPRQSPGWLEQNTMDVLRARLLKRLCDADRFGRLRVYYPIAPGDSDTPITVHAKVLVIDHRLVHIGSSNLANRSMGLDTECDLAIDAAGDIRVERAIAAFRNRLLGEHLGVSTESVGEELSTKGSLVAAIDALRGAGRRLEPIQITVPEWLDRLVPPSAMLDPERPLPAEALLGEFVHEDAQQVGMRRLLPSLGLLLVLAGLAAAWRWTPLAAWLDLETLVNWTVAVRDHPLAPVGVILAYMIGGLVAVPVTVMIMATAFTFGPLLGFTYSLLGSLFSAMLTYGVGYLLGREAIRGLAGSHLNRLSRKIARRGLLAILVVRMLPIAPFTVVNIIAGASHIRFRDFALGTLLGMLPGIFIISLLGEQLAGVVRQPELENLLVFVGIVALIGLAAAWLRWRFADTDGGMGRQSHEPQMR